MTTVFFHATRAMNRDSIKKHGLDWRRMTHRGIANSDKPEVEGIFLARDRREADYFVQMGSSDGDMIDVWQVTLAYEFDPQEPRLVDVPFYTAPEGYLVCTETISPSFIELLEG